MSPCGAGPRQRRLVRPPGPAALRVRARLGSALTSSAAVPGQRQLQLQLPLPLLVLLPEPELPPPLRFDRLSARRPARSGKAPPPGAVPGQRDPPTLSVLPNGLQGVQTGVGAETPVTG